MLTVESFFALDPMTALREEIIAMIIDAHQNAPRSQQVELGPSEIGHPCSRRMAYSLANDPVPRCNPQWDPLPSIIGTATHAWLETAAALANTNLGRDRWLTETKVYPATWLSGNCDLYDVDTGTVIDYKVPGVNQFSLLSRSMSPVYRTQVHLYGKGFANLGHRVERVAIMLIPRGGTLAKAYLWSEAYDEEVANAAIDHRLRIGMMLEDLNVSSNPERFEWFQKIGYQCIFCPFYSPRPNGPLQCNGDGVLPPIP